MNIDNETLRCQKKTVLRNLHIALTAAAVVRVCNSVKWILYYVCVCVFCVMFTVANRTVNVLRVSVLAVAQEFEALHHKPEGSGFRSQWCHWRIPSGRTMALGLVLAVSSEGRCWAGLTSTPPRVDCLVIREPHPPGILRTCPEIAHLF
jgi:hypothetical protein